MINLNGDFQNLAKKIIKSSTFNHFEQNLQLNTEYPTLYFIFLTATKTTGLAWDNILT